MSSFCAVFQHTKTLFRILLYLSPKQDFQVFTNNTKTISVVITTRTIVIYVVPKLRTFKVM